MATGAAARGVKPPAEVVLPWVYYLLLVSEAAALTWLFWTHDVSAREPVGYWIGWIGTGSMLAMHVYSIRKRVRALSGWGKLSTWLHVHIFLGLQGALLVCFHSAHLATLRNISGATILGVLVVVVSGMFGRYLFSFLPKGISGERLTALQIEKELAELEPQFKLSAQPAIEAAMTELSAKSKVTGRLGLAGLVAEDVRTRRALRHLESAARSIVRADGNTDLEYFISIVRRRAQLVRKLTVLETSEKLFRRWHFFHKPLTFLLLGAVVLHIVAHFVYAAQFTAMWVPR